MVYTQQLPHDEKMALIAFKRKSFFFFFLKANPLSQLFLQVCQNGFLK